MRWVSVILTLGLHALLAAALSLAFEIAFQPPQPRSERIVAIRLAPAQSAKSPPARQSAKAPRPVERSAVAPVVPIVVPPTALLAEAALGAAPGLPSGADRDPVGADDYRRSLHDHLARARRYPAEAVRRHMEGRTLVAFLLRRDGRVSNLAVLRSSGTGMLDEAATEAVRRAEPFPTIPDDLPEYLDITVPVEFALDRKGALVAMQLP